MWLTEPHERGLTRAAAVGEYRGAGPCRFGLLDREAPSDHGVPNLLLAMLRDSHLIALLYNGFARRPG